MQPNGFATHIELARPHRSLELVTANISASGRAVALWAEPDTIAALDVHTTAANGVRAPLSRLEREVPVWITITDPDNGATVTIAAQTRHAAPHIALLPEGVVIAAARCAHDGTEPESNATLIGRDGQTLAEGVLGDGIAQLTATSDGQLAVGYFDEGIVGDFGWGDGGPKPVGEPGIVLFDSDLQQRWAMPPTTPPITCCYAIPPTDDGALWCTWHARYPIVRLHRGQISTWTNRRLSNTGTLAVLDDKTVAFLGGLDPDTGQRHGGVVTAGRLTEDGFTPYATWRPDTNPAHVQAQIVRGSVLHRIDSDGVWHRLDLAEVEDLKPSTRAPAPSSSSTGV